jgi:hypothetical protein
MEDGIFGSGRCKQFRSGRTPGPVSGKGSCLHQRSLPANNSQPPPWFVSPRTSWRRHESASKAIRGTRVRVSGRRIRALIKARGDTRRGMEDGTFDSGCCEQFRSRRTPGPVLGKGCQGAGHLSGADVFAAPVRNVVGTIALRLLRLRWKLYFRRHLARYGSIFTIRHDFCI